MYAQAHVQGSQPRAPRRSRASGPPHGSIRPAGSSAAVAAAAAAAQRALSASPKDAAFEAAAAAAQRALTSSPRGTPSSTINSTLLSASQARRRRRQLVATNGGHPADSLVDARQVIDRRRREQAEDSQQFQSTDATHGQSACTGAGSAQMPPRQWGNGSSARPRHAGARNGSVEERSASGSDRDLASERQRSREAASQASRSLGAGGSGVSPQTCHPRPPSGPAPIRYACVRACARARARARTHVQWFNISSTCLFPKGDKFLQRQVREASIVS